jgi:hypothetical protein
VRYALKACATDRHGDAASVPNRLTELVLRSARASLFFADMGPVERVTTREDSRATHVDTVPRSV